METANILKQLEAQDEHLLRAVKQLAKTISGLSAESESPEVKPRALLVGGFVRDAVLGLKPKDADMEVYGVGAKRLEEVLNKLFPDRVNAVGRAFGVFKINVGEGLEFDVSIPRRESKTGRGHRGFSIEGDPGMTITEAARRRDFTMNALAADPLTGEVFDDFDGVNDLNERMLRVTDPERFQDDPLRVYRALQFVARFDLAADAPTKKLMTEMVERGDMDELAKERVTEEIRKLLLKAAQPSVGFELARDIGIIERYLPELHALIDLPQEAEWHPEGDVWTHTMLTLDAAAVLVRQPSRGLTDDETLQVLLGTLCHDLGKATTTGDVNGRIRALGHEEAGVEPTKALCGRWTFPKDAVDAAVTCAKEHLKPFMLWRSRNAGQMSEDQYANAVRKLLKRIAPMSWRVLITVSEADFRGRTIAGVDTELYTTGLMMGEAITRLALDREAAKPLIMGRDLLDLGVQPGPKMGEIIKQVENARDEGTIATREEAMALAKNLIL
jgi:tRNA nucleotidyltransferase (CCA-adding enzyme)